MDKIFDKEVQDYLKSVGVSICEIQRLQYNALKDGAVKILKEITKLIETEKYEIVFQSLSSSPAGDGYGTDNNYIEFGGITGVSSLDISDLCASLESLKQAIECRTPPTEE